MHLARDRNEDVTFKHFFSVLRDVVRLECGDAQADGDCETIVGHHSASDAVPTTGASKSGVICCFVYKKTSKQMCRWQPLLSEHDILPWWN